MWSAHNWAQTLDIVRLLGCLDAPNRTSTGQNPGPVDRAFDDRLSFSCPWKLGLFSLSRICSLFEQSCDYLRNGEVFQNPFYNPPHIAFSERCAMIKRATYDHVWLHNSLRRASQALLKVKDVMRCHMWSAHNWAQALAIVRLFGFIDAPNRTFS